MNRIARICAGVALASAVFAGPAQATGGRDAAVYQTIMSGDYASAEGALLPRLRAGEATPELLLNLAALYALTDRPEAAQALYRWVLSERDVTMDLSMREGDTKSAHAIARDGLSRLTLASR